ncbi:MAG: sulfotransferase domain-containing protein [Desulfobacterales bacterium]|nr:sulfotransferase domain-containing protein [Desulfobacterales bacterium]
MDTDKKKKSPVKSVLSSMLGGVSIMLKISFETLSRLCMVVDFVRWGYLDFMPRPDDIFIVTYPRSGTTWMQMILYQLSSDGNMDFHHISQVSPWFERLISFNVMSQKDIEALPSPRIFKSHLSYKQIPKGPCRYIYVARDGKDVAVSFFHFYKSHLGFKGTFPDFFDLFMRGKVQYGSWFEHVVGWQARKNDPNVLFLKYEDLITDLEGCIRRIIEFCGFETPEDRFPEILERCSFAFMKKHESKFDHIAGMVWEKGYTQNSFFRKGQTGDGKQYFTAEQEELFGRKADKYFV